MAIQTDVGWCQAIFESRDARKYCESAASVAFPAISTGIYGYPRAAAAKIAVDTVRAWCESLAAPERVVFCCFSDDDAAVYRSLLET